MNMTKRKPSQVYDLWSKTYDCTFGAMTLNRQRCAIGQLRLRRGENVLDLGIGTGAALSLYPRHVRVVGMDLSSGMLTHASAKRDQLERSHCYLVRGDALRCPFAESSFDHVVISHTISVVSDPHRVMYWAAKLVKPAGRVVVLNHFQSPRIIMATLEKVLNPLCMWMGWRSDLTLEALLQGIDLELEYCFQLRLVDLWKIVVLRRPTTQPTRGSMTSAQSYPLGLQPAGLFSGG